MSVKISTMRYQELIDKEQQLLAITDAWKAEPTSDGTRVAHKSVQDWWPELAALLLDQRERE